MKILKLHNKKSPTSKGSEVNRTLTKELSSADQTLEANLTQMKFLEKAAITKSKQPQLLTGLMEYEVKINKILQERKLRAQENMLKNVKIEVIKRNIAA